MSVRSSGRWRKRSNGEILPQSSYGEAVTCFEKAIELNPNRLIDSAGKVRIWSRNRLPLEPTLLTITVHDSLS